MERRAFFGTIGGALAGGAVFGSRAVQGKKKGDPLTDYLVGRMVANHATMKHDGVRARHVYRHADAVRAFAAYAAGHTDVDARVRASVATTVRQHGRAGAAAAVRHVQAQCLECQADLVGKGFDSTDLRGTGPVSTVVQQRGIDLLHVVGLSALLTREADVLERRAQQIERTFGAGLYNPNGGLIVNAYTTCDDWWDDGCTTDGGSSGTNCSNWSATVHAKDVLTAWICYDPFTVETCPLMIVNLAAVKFMAWWAGC